MEQTYLEQLVNIVEMITPSVQDRMDEGDSFDEAMLKLMPKDVGLGKSRPLLFAPRTVIGPKNDKGVEVRLFGTRPKTIKTDSKLPGRLRHTLYWSPLSVLRPIKDDEMEELIETGTIEENDKKAALKILFSSELGGIYTAEGVMLRSEDDEGRFFVNDKLSTEILRKLLVLQYEQEVELSSPKKVSKPK